MESIKRTIKLIQTSLCCCCCCCIDRESEPKQWDSTAVSEKLWVGRSLQYSSQSLSNTAWKGDLIIRHPQPLILKKRDSPVALSKSASRIKSNRPNISSSGRNKYKTVVIVREVRKKKNPSSQSLTEESSRKLRAHKQCSGDWSTDALRSKKGDTKAKSKWTTSTHIRTSSQSISSFPVPIKRSVLDLPLPVEYNSGYTYNLMKADCTRKAYSFTEPAKESTFGNVQFSVSYYKKNQMLLIFIYKINNLPPKGKSKCYHTHVIVSILPDKLSQCSTLLPSSLDPDVQEEFYFILKDIQHKELKISVFDQDRTDEYYCIGHVVMSLSDVTSVTNLYHMELLKRAQQTSCKMELCISLGYNKNNNILNMRISQGRDLEQCKRGNNAQGVHIQLKGVLYNRGKKIQTCKSNLITYNEARKIPMNSLFNFQMKQPLTGEELIVLKVFCRGFIRDVLLGHIIFGHLYCDDAHSLTSWGRVILAQEYFTQWYRLYL